jgi:tetratricopeptide (TPR) repeat protein
VAVDREKVVQAAQKYAEKKRYDKAIVEYQRVLAEDPNDARILLKIAELQTKGELYPAAIETYERVGRLYAQQGFPQKAIAVYNQLRELLGRHAPQLEDRHGGVFFELARLHQQLGHIADAIALWEQIAAKHQRTGHDLDAAEAFRKLVELDGNNPLHQLRLAEALARARNIEGAIAQFRSAADLLIRLGHADNALKVYERLLQIRPDPAVARLAASLYLERNQGNDAMMALAKLQIAFQANQKDLDTLSLLARSFEQLNQPSKAIEVYKEQVRLARELNDKATRKFALQRAAALAPNDEQVKALVRANPTSSIPAPPHEPVSLEPISLEPDPDPDLLVGGTEDPYLDDFEVVDDASELEIDDEPPSRSPAIPPPPPPPLPARSTIQAIPPRPPAPSVEVRVRSVDEAPRSIGEVAVPSSLRAVEESTAGFDSDLEEASLIQETLAEVSAFRRLRQLPRAIESLQIALEVLPSSLPLREQLRDLYLETGDQEGAIGEMITLATLAIDQGDTDGANNILQEALLLSPGHQRAQELLDSLDFGGLQPVEDEGEGAMSLEFDEDPAPAPVTSPPRAFELDDDPFGGVPFERVANFHQPPPAASVRPQQGLDLELDEPTMLVATAHTAATTPPPPEADLEFDDEASFELGLPADNFAVPLATSLPPALATTPPRDPTPTPNQVFTSASAFALDEPDFETPAPQAPPVPAPELSGELEFDPPRANAALQLARGFQGGDAVEDALEEVDFFASRGLYEDARAIVQEQLERAPNHPILLERLRELEEAEAAQNADLSDPEPQPSIPEAVNTELLDASLDALDSFEPTQEAHGHFQREEEQVDIESVFAKFKEGVKAQVDDSDSATHYDLGVAYKEMNLLQDAISEFYLAARDPLRACVCYSMVAMIELERGHQKAALEAFQQALHSPEKTTDQELSLLYEVGLLHESLDERAAALDSYRRIQRRDPSYRDVAQRIAALEPRSAVRQIESEVDLDTLFDDILGGKSP